MGSATQRRWPKNAEAARRETEIDAEEAARLLTEARENLRKNPLLAELQIADAKTILADIRRRMVEAKVGIE